MLSDEVTVGVYFNDRSVMVLKEGSDNFFYLNYPQKMVREHLFKNVENSRDIDFKHKVNLL